MRMVFEEFCGRFMRRGANHSEGTHLVGDVGNPPLIDSLGLTQGPPMPAIED